MLIKASKTVGMIVVLMFLFATLSFAQGIIGNSGNNETMKPEMAKKKSPIVREGQIDLEAIDANKDGKVFQDPMDYNVISDKPGKCPLCGMTLKEVTLEEAKGELINNGFKVKQ